MEAVLIAGVSTPLAIFAIIFVTAVTLLAPVSDLDLAKAYLRIFQMSRVP